MKEIVVLGAGPAGLSFLERLKQTPCDCKLTLIDTNLYSFNKPDFLNDFSFKNRIDLNQWTKDRGIEFINDRLERVSIRRRKLYFKNRESRGFEGLVVASGLRSKKLPAKGEHREGFFYLAGADPLKLTDRIKISREATVYITSILGLKVALNLAALGKEINIVGDLDFVGQRQQELLDHLRRANISLYLGAAIEEAIGEGTLRAVKINPLKVISSQMLFLDSGFIANRDFFEEGVAAEEHGLSDQEGVYIIGDANYPAISDERFFIFNYQEAQAQAASLADYIARGRPLEFKRKQPSPEDKARAIEEVFSRFVIRRESSNGPVNSDLRSEHGA